MWRNVKNWKANYFRKKWLFQEKFSCEGNIAQSSFEGGNVKVKSSNFDESGQLMKRREIPKLILWYTNACKLKDSVYTCAVD